MTDSDDNAAENTRGASRPGGASVDPKLLEILVCPLTKGPLRYDRERQELISDQAGPCRASRRVSSVRLRSEPETR